MPQPIASMLCDSILLFQDQDRFIAARKKMLPRSGEWYTDGRFLRLHDKAALVCTLLRHACSSWWRRWGTRSAWINFSSLLCLHVLNAQIPWCTLLPGGITAFVYCSLFHGRRVSCVDALCFLLWVLWEGLFKLVFKQRPFWSYSAGELCSSKTYKLFGA